MQDYSPGRYNCTSLLYIFMREIHALWEEIGMFLMIYRYHNILQGLGMQTSLKNVRKSKSAHGTALYSNKAGPREMGLPCCLDVEGQNRVSSFHTPWAPATLLSAL